MSSYVSQFPSVRKILTHKQREIARRWSRSVPVVVEGRDIGTVVFPKVKNKFFVTAHARIRALRRYKELRVQGEAAISVATMLRKNRARDSQDSKRAIAPLKKARTAVVIDTSRMSVSEVVRKILKLIGN